MVWTLCVDDFAGGPLVVRVDFAQCAVQCSHKPLSFVAHHGADAASASLWSTLNESCHHSQTHDVVSDKLTWAPDPDFFQAGRVVLAFSSDVYVVMTIMAGKVHVLEACDADGIACPAYKTRTELADLVLDQEMYVEDEYGTMKRSETCHRASAKTVVCFHDDSDKLHRGGDLPARVTYDGGVVVCQEWFRHGQRGGRPRAYDAGQPAVAYPADPVKNEWWVGGGDNGVAPPAAFVKDVGADGTLLRRWICAHEGSVTIDDDGTRSTWRQGKLHSWGDSPAVEGSRPVRQFLAMITSLQDAACRPLWAPEFGATYGLAPPALVISQDAAGKPVVREWSPSGLGLEDLVAEVWYCDGQVRRSPGFDVQDDDPELRRVLIRTREDAHHAAFHRPDVLLRRKTTKEPVASLWLSPGRILFHGSNTQMWVTRNGRHGTAMTPHRDSGLPAVQFGDGRQEWWVRGRFVKSNGEEDAAASRLAPVQAKAGHGVVISPGFAAVAATVV